MWKVADFARKCCATALFIVATAWPSAATVPDRKSVPGRSPAREAARDRQSIELAKAIMAGDAKFRQLISGADPNAVIFINYENKKYDLSLLTIATLLGAEDVIAALVLAGARRGYSCDVDYLVTASLPLNSVLPQFTIRRAGLPRIMTGQTALSCFLAAPYRKAANPSDQRLLDAVVEGNLAAVRRALSRGADKNAREIKLPGQVVWPGRTALMMALIERQAEIAKFLISSGVDVDAKAAIASRWGGVDGIDPMKIAIYQKQREIFTLLLQRGADASAADENGNMAVHDAAANGDVAVLSALLGDDPRLKAKSAIIARNKSGEAPMVLAVRSHQPDVVAFLIGRAKELYGSDFLDYWGSAAVDEALRPRFVGSQGPSAIDGVRSKAGEILTMLLNGGADASFKDEDGRTVLMRAIQDGFNLDVIKSVIDVSPHVDVVDRFGKDAHTLARDRPDAKELEMLLNATRKQSP